MYQSGLKIEHPKRKDYVFELVFGVGELTDIKPIGRDISGIPVVFQGQQNTCVACSITWVKQYFEEKHPDLSHEFLAKISNTAIDGASFSQVLEPARLNGICTQTTWRDAKIFEEQMQNAAQHKLDGYSYIRNITSQSLYSALILNPVIIGVNKFKNIGPHALVAYDVSDDGKRLKCVNWWKADMQDIVEVDFSDVISAIVPMEIPDAADKKTIRLSAPSFFADFLRRRMTKNNVSMILGALLLFFGIISGQKFGYAPVTDYESRTTQYVNASATTIPVASTKDKSGQEIVIGDISPSSTVRTYFVLEAGTSREEIITCTGKSTGNWTSCSRGLAFQGGSPTASTTLAKAHNAGSSIIMTNVGQFYAQEFVDLYSSQDINGLKQFHVFPRVVTTGTLPTLSSQFATKQYVDNVGAGGFTASNVSSTLGLQAISSGTPNCPTAAACVGIFASTTGLAFSIPSGAIYVTTTPAGGLTVDTGGGLMFDGSDNFTFSATVTSTGKLRVPEPTHNADAASKQYVDSAAAFSFATGTAGVAIAAGQSIRAGGDGRLYLTNANATNTVYEFVGIAVDSASGIGQEIRYAKHGSMVTSTGLTAAAAYYLSDSNGSFSTTPGTIPVKIGFAQTTTTLLVTRPNFRARTTGSQSICTGTTASAATTWIPTSVKLYCSGSSNTASQGEWVRLQGGSSSTYSLGNSNTSPFWVISANYTCNWNEGGTQYNVGVVTTTGGFGITCNQSGGGRTVYYIAEYEEL